MIENNIRDYVNDKHLSIPSLAKAMGMKYEAFYSIVNGKRKISAEELLKFCYATDCSPDEIFGYESKDKTKKTKDTLKDKPKNKVTDK